MHSVHLRWNQRKTSGNTKGRCHHRWQFSSNLSQKEVCITLICLSVRQAWVSRSSHKIIHASPQGHAAFSRIWYHHKFPFSFKRSWFLFGFEQLLHLHQPAKCPWPFGCTDTRGEQRIEANPSHENVQFCWRWGPQSWCWVLASRNHRRVSIDITNSPCINKMRKSKWQSFWSRGENKNVWNANYCI